MHANWPEGWTYSRIALTGAILDAGRFAHLPGHGGRDRVMLEPSDPKLDYITRLAVSLTGSDIGGISLIFRSQIWLPSRVGVDARLLPLAGSFCNCAVRAHAPLFEVADARLDARFADNPLVTAPPHYLHYAGIPLDGSPARLLGTLWVMSKEPHHLDAEQVAQLQLMARIVADLLEHRYFEPSTGMFNRTVFLHHLETMLAPEEARVTVGFIDLAGFRQVNEMFGRQSGDRILGQLGDRLAAWGGDRALLGHLGSDRFAFALELPPDQLDTCLAELRDAIDLPFAVGNGYVQPLHGRIGIWRQGAERGASAVDALDAADGAASSIRRSLDHSVMLEYDSAIAARARLRYELRHAMRGDRRHGRIEVHYQPQVDVEAGKLIGLEALVRWCHPEFGLVGPAMFVPQAEQSGRIFELDSHVARLVCEDMKGWLSRGLDPVPVALNFSRVSLMHPELFARLESVLADTGVPGSLIELEVTESIVLDSLQSLCPRITALRALGMHIAIDDFGTGSSNLDALAGFTFDRLKADRQFVHGVAADHKKAGLFSLIQDAARVFDAELICEGLEHEADLAWLTTHGVHCVQGWLFSRARTAADIEHLLLRLRETQETMRSFGDLRALLHHEPRA